MADKKNTKLNQNHFKGRKRENIPTFFSLMSRNDKNFNKGLDKQDKSLWLKIREDIVYNI